MKGEAPGGDRKTDRKPRSRETDGELQVEAMERKDERWRENGHAKKKKKRKGDIEKEGGGGEGGSPKPRQQENDRDQ